MKGLVYFMRMFDLFYLCRLVEVKSGQVGYNDYLCTPSEAPSNMASDTVTVIVACAIAGFLRFRLEILRATVIE